MLFIVFFKGFGTQLGAFTSFIDPSNLHCCYCLSFSLSFCLCFASFVLFEHLNHCFNFFLRCLFTFSYLLSKYCFTDLPSFLLYITFVKIVWFFQTKHEIFQIFFYSFYLVTSNISSTRRNALWFGHCVLVCKTSMDQFKFTDKHIN